MEPHDKRTEEAATGDALMNTLEEAQRLMRLEVLLVKEELRQEAKAMKTATMGFAAAIAFALTGLTLLALSGALASASSTSVTMGLGIAAFVAAALCAFIAFRKAPKKPLLEEASAEDGRVGDRAIREGNA